MQRTISEREASEGLRQLLDEVSSSGDEVVIERNGQPVGVVIPPRLYKALTSERDRFWTNLRKVQARNSGVSEEELNADIEAAIAEVRSEQRNARRG